jgi:ribosomal protein S27AE
MLAIQGLMRPVGDHIAARPACPNCGRPMHLTRHTPGTGGLADLRTYGCGECGVWVTEAVEA